jgi:hypothetical protein
LRLDTLGARSPESTHREAKRPFVLPLWAVVGPWVVATAWAATLWAYCPLLAAGALLGAAAGVTVRAVRKHHARAVLSDLGVTATDFRRTGDFLLLSAV